MIGTFALDSAMNAWLVVSSVILLWMIGQLYVPWGGRVQGPVVYRDALSGLGRLRRFGRGVAFGIASCIAGWWFGDVSPAVAGVLAAVFLALLAVPSRYTLTTQGIAPDRTAFRRWTEFGGVARRPGGVRLGGVAGNRGMTIWLSGGRDDDDFVLLLRQLVRGSYKGTTDTETQRTESSPTYVSESPRLSGSWGN